MRLLLGPERVFYSLNVPGNRPCAAKVRLTAGLGITGDIHSFSLPTKYPLPPSTTKLITVLWFRSARPLTATPLL